MNRSSSSSKHSLANLFLAISTFALEIFGFICFFVVWCSLFGEAEISAVAAILILLIPHLVLFLLNMLFIYILTKGLKLNKIFCKTWQIIAIILFALPWIVIFLSIINS